MATAAAASAATPAAPAVDAAKYAENLRKRLMADLFEGEELEEKDDLVNAYTLGDYVGAHQSEITLQDLDQDLEEFQDHEVIRGILEQGRVLKEYARGIDDKLAQVEMDSIQDYIQESDNLVALHDQIRHCDTILSHLEQLLGKFQGDLGKVSEEIRQLQVQSQSMSTKLKNRRSAEASLGHFIDHMAVSQDLVTSILEKEVSEDYLEYLLELDKKLKFVVDDEVACSSQAKRDVEPALEKLRIKALTKLRDFMLAKIYQLKRPKTNVQIIQQSVLLKYKFFVRFLRQHGQDVYRELRNEYVDIMSRIMSAHFRTYLGAMERLQVAVATQADVLGAPDGAHGGSSGGSVLSLFNKNTQRPTTEAIFAAGDRMSVLADSERPAIIPHQAEAEGRRFPYEVVFRNVHKLLLDTATSEFFFCLDFFEDEQVFRDLFYPIIQVVEGELSEAMQELWDLVSIVIMIRINHDHRRVMLKRRVPCLDDYLDRVHLLIWPRFKVLFDAQMASIRNGTEKVLFNGEWGVHYMVRRYAALASSLLLLMAEYDTEEQGLYKAHHFFDMMERMWSTLVHLLMRMSNMFKDTRHGIIFLVMNYNHILTTMRAADAHAAAAAGAAAIAAANAAAAATSSTGAPAPPRGAIRVGRVGAHAFKECEDQLNNCTTLYVDDQLAVHFKDLVDFVRRAEQAQKRSAVPEGQHVPGFAPPQAAPILKDFALRWQSSIEAMHSEVLRQFPDSACGRDVLQSSMTSLLKYYTRLLELLKRQGTDGQALAKDAPSVPSIMYEIRRYSKA